MKPIIEFFILAFLVFVADYLWLGVIMKGFYQQELGALMRQGPQGFSPRIAPAILVYLLIPLGVLLFVGPRVDPHGSLLTAAVWGATFGLIVYGIYDLSNLAILQDWKLRVTIADILWGMFLCGISAVVLYFVRITMLSDKA